MLERSISLIIQHSLTVKKKCLYLKKIKTHKKRIYTNHNQLHLNSLSNIVNLRSSSPGTALHKLQHSINSSKQAGMAWLLEQMHFYLTLLLLTLWVRFRVGFSLCGSLRYF